jgi:hypothetical protein
MRTSDVLARVGGFLMLFTAMWNLFSSMLMFFALVWLLVGVFWLIPLALGVLELILGIVFLVVGHNKGVAAGPILGLGIAMCNLNPMGVFLEFVVLLVMIASYAARASEDRDLTQRVYA